MENAELLKNVLVTRKINLFKEVLVKAVSILQDKDEDMSDYVQLDKKYIIDHRDPEKVTTYAIIFNYSKPNDVIKLLIKQVFELPASEQQKQELVLMILDYELNQLHSQYQMFWDSLDSTNGDS